MLGASLCLQGNYRVAPKKRPELCVLLLIVYFMERNFLFRICRSICTVTPPPIKSKFQWRHQWCHWMPLIWNKKS